MNTPTPESPTPNELPTVLGVGSSAIEAAARALAGEDPDWRDYTTDATAALSAAYPLMEAQAKAEALREAADLIEAAQKMITIKPGHGTVEEESNFADWDEASRGAWDEFDQSVRFLRARAATIEGKDS